MDRIRRAYVDQIEPHTNTFSRLSHCLMQTTVLSDVWMAMQSIDVSYTRACARRFLSHYIVHYFPGDVVGETGATEQRAVVVAADGLFHVHCACTTEPSAFSEALREYVGCFHAWQSWDKAQLARTYRDVYRLLDEIKVGSPVEIQAPVAKLQRTLDAQTKQIFGADAREVRHDVDRVELQGDCRALERFVHHSVHELYWSEMAAKLEQNSFDSMCDVVDHVKERMLALCASRLKRDEVTAYLDVAFLRNVLHVGMAQTQVKSLVSYCLRFLREYGQPCHDADVAALIARTEALYPTADAVGAIPSLVGLIREIAERVDDLVDVVCALSRDASERDV
jgi:hypothetical protein